MSNCWGQAGEERGFVFLCFSGILVNEKILLFLHNLWFFPALQVSLQLLLKLMGIIDLAYPLYILTDSLETRVL